jgi:hypothetical protein
MIANCGINCKKCGAYIATQTNSEENLRKVAKEWGAYFKKDIPPESIACDGCLTEGRKSFFCTDICEIRVCCTEKEIDNCAFCKDFSCSKLEEIFKIAPDAEKNLRKIKVQ